MYGEKIGKQRNTFIITAETEMKNFKHTQIIFQPIQTRKKTRIMHVELII